MWDYANDAELYYEKAVHHFASKCFDKWTKLEAHHSLTIVFFKRTINVFQSVNDSFSTTT